MNLLPDRGPVGAWAAAVLLAACSASTPYPEDWSAASASSAWCERPTGHFAVRAARSSDVDAEGEATLPLTEVFFGNLLNGFSVTHLSFETLETGELRVRPWVGDVVLREQRIVEPSGRSCDDDRWRVSTGWNLDGYMATAGLLYTGGIVIPGASEQHFLLTRSEQGDLVVRFVARTAGTVFFFFPFRTVDADLWFLYPPAVAQHD